LSYLLKSISPNVLAQVFRAEHVVHPWGVLHVVVQTPHLFSPW
jgi:hypothetical protein